MNSLLGPTFSKLSQLFDASSRLEQARQADASTRLTQARSKVDAQASTVRASLHPDGFEVAKRSLVSLG
jgi:hypothetical protein